MNTQNRKPRLLIAGEFSSGKTQLITGLLGEEILPSNVTSTSLPPMWIRSDVEASTMVDLTGQREPLPDLDDVSATKTAFCEMQHDAEFLQHFDVIDTPGNSDPNIPPESWMRMLKCADVVVWCTNATQAWRQSEKAVWLDMKPELCVNATLLITHADRVFDPKSRERLERRVVRDSKEFFSHHMVVSLIAPDDLERIKSHLISLAPSIELTGADVPEFEQRQRGIKNIKVRKIRVNRSGEVELSETAKPAEPAEQIQAEPVAPQIEALPEKSAVAPTPTAAELVAKVAEPAIEAPKAEAPVSEVAERTEDQTASLIKNVLQPQTKVLPFAQNSDRKVSVAEKIWEGIVEGKDTNDVTVLHQSIRVFLKEIDQRLMAEEQSPSRDPKNALL